MMMLAFISWSYSIGASSGVAISESGKAAMATTDLIDLVSRDEQNAYVPYSSLSKLVLYQLLKMVVFFTGVMLRMSVLV